MKNKTISGIPVLAVFALFAGCVLAVLLTGAGLVRSITLRDRSSYDQRTAVQYLTTRVRRGDTAGAVRAEDPQTLVLLEDIGGITYETRIYCHEGSLREMYCETGCALAPGFGEEILPMEALRVSLEEGLLRLSFRLPQGEETTVLLRLRIEEEVAP